MRLAYCEPRISNLLGHCAKRLHVGDSNLEPRTSNLLGHRAKRLHIGNYLTIITQAGACHPPWRRLWQGMWPLSNVRGPFPYARIMAANLWWNSTGYVLISCILNSFSCSGWDCVQLWYNQRITCTHARLKTV